MNYSQLSLHLLTVTCTNTAFKNKEQLSYRLSNFPYFPLDLDSVSGDRWILDKLSQSCRLRHFCNTGGRHGFLWRQRDRGLCPKSFDCDLILRARDRRSNHTQNKTIGQSFNRSYPPIYYKPSYEKGKRRKAWKELTKKVHPSFVSATQRDLKIQTTINLTQWGSH